MEILDNSSGGTSIRLGGGTNKIILNDSSGTEHLNPKNFQITSTGNDYLIGIVPGQTLLVSALNTANPRSSEQGEPVSMQVKAYDKEGNVIAESDVVEVLPNQFRTVRFRYEDLHMSEPRTGRKQARLRMFSIIDRTQLSPGVQPIFPAATLLVLFETVDDNTGKTVFADGSVRFISSSIPSN